MRLTILGRPWQPPSPDVHDGGGASARGPHRLASAMTCEIQWTERYWLRRRPRIEGGARLQGTAIHAAVQAADDPNIDPARAKAFVEAAASGQDRVVATAQAAQSAREQRTKSGRAIAHEIELWAPLREIFSSSEIVEAERRLLSMGAVDLGSEVVTARADAIVELEDGSLSWDDLKSTAFSARKDGKLSRWDSEQNEFRFSSQVHWGLLIGRAHYAREGRDLRHFRVERIQSKSPYDGDCRVVRRAPETYASARRLLLAAVVREFQIVDRIRHRIRLEQEGVARGACYGRFRCDYRELCAAESSDIRRSIVQIKFTPKVKRA